MTIDCGLRGIIFDEQGNELAKSEELFTGYYSQHFQWKGSGPGNVLAGTGKGRSGSSRPKKWTCFRPSRGPTVSCQRDVITVVDEKGEPLRNFISWLDRRELAEPLPYPWPYTLLFKCIGFSDYAKSFSKTAHVNWIKVHEPEIWAKTDKVVFLSTYFLSRLTGRIADSRSDTAGHLPFDTKKKQWCGKYNVKTQILQVDPEKCYELTDSCQIIGRLTAEAAEMTGLPSGLPIVASGTDKGCETIGVGALTPDIAQYFPGNPGHSGDYHQNTWSSIPSIPPLRQWRMTPIIPRLLFITAFGWWTGMPENFLISLIPKRSMRFSRAIWKPLGRERMV